jgi:hypothetical protein
MNGSPRWTLSLVDWQKVGTGLLIGLTGAVLTWITKVLVPALEQTSDEQLLLLAAVLAAIANAFRKALTDTRSRS